MPRAQLTDTPKYPIESIDNALRLLLMLRQTTSLSVNDAASELGVAPSTAHRVLAMLQHHGFVEQNPATRTYRVGATLVEIGLSALREFDIRHSVRPELERLAAQLDETAHLAVLRGGRTLFLDAVESSKILRAASRVGQSLPGYATASGKAVLAALPDDEVKRLYPQARLGRVTGQTQTSREGLFRELATIRRVGYATNLGESEEGLVAVASAIIDSRGTPYGALTVAAPEARLHPRALPKTGSIVAQAARRAAKNVDASLGAAPHTPGPRR
jgi:DNA-binding IclR family transcriptional regulator